MSNLIYYSKFSFYEYYSINFNSLSLTSKFKVLTSFFNKLNKFYRLILQQESTKKKKLAVCGNASEMYNEYLETYFHEYTALSDNKKSNLDNNCDPVNLFLFDVYNYDDWLKNKESPETDIKESVDLSEMPPLGDEKVREGTGLKLLTPNKLLIRLSILLAQIRTGNNSNKLKNTIREILYLSYQHRKINKKSFQQFHQVITIVGETIIVIRDPKTFCFNLDWPIVVDENVKHEIEFMIKNNESLAKNKIRNDIEQLLLKYKHGNSIHKHGKQQNE